MCHYVTLVMSAEAHDRLAAIFPTYYLSPYQIINPSVTSHLKPGELYWCARAGLCHCGTGLGSMRDRGPRFSAEEIRELNRLRKKGWSEARLERWQAEKREAVERQSQATEERYKPSANRWYEFLLASHTEKIGILLHWYGHSVETELLAGLQREVVRRSELDVGFLMQIKEDVIYEFD